MYEVLRLEVLEQVRDLAVDLSDPETVRNIARQVVETYQASARQGLGVRSLAAPAQMVERLERSLLEYGPLTPFLDGTIDYEELMIHGADVTYIDRAGNLQSHDELTTESEIRSIVTRLLSTVGATVDDSRPIIQAQILNGTARIGVVIPPISDKINVTLRRYVVRRDTFQDLMDSEVAQMPFKRIVCKISVSAMELEGLIDDIETHIGHFALSHCCVSGRIGRLGLDL